MEKWQERTALLVGEDFLDKLSHKHVLIVGLGGVGGFAAEFLARAGIGQLTIVDGDVFDLTNINRQITALHSTIGQPKAEILGQRLRDISPNIRLNIIHHFLTPEEIDALFLAQTFDSVCDCIDSITPKIHLIETALRHQIPLISSMGAGGKMDPSQVRIAKLSQTHGCKLAKTIRARTKNHRFYTVYSPEPSRPNSLKLTDGTNFKRSFYGTISYMPACFGLMIASHVIQEFEKTL